jgi:two-component system chemotaxis sensor kinase CheA
MGFEADDEILQDFLVEAGEILEQLSAQLVELESRPDDRDLLNTIFRGFHTVKGGAGFLQLTELVDCCHVAENVFDTLRNGLRTVDADLMDCVLSTLDVVNDMFTAVSAGEALAAADSTLLARLHFYAQATSANASELTSINAAKDSSAVGHREAGQDISDAEFEQLLDAIAPVPSNAEAGAGSEPGVASDEISDDEFEALLDQLHGKGKHGASNNDSDLDSEKAPERSDDISDAEFEALLDQLHGKGQFANIDGSAPVRAQQVPPQRPAEPVFTAPISTGAAQADVATPAPAAAVDRRSPNGAAKSSTNAQESTVRVDTQRLDDILNMVGELVLVRNRLVRLGAELDDEALQKAVGNLNVVTADLQASVMKTRMQPIKKVFGRFPRVVRDLARTLKKEVNLEMVGEETDLDKNLVDALADPLVHLVRNSVDHGVETPDVRAANGKPRMGRIVLAAQQEGDHILLTIMDDGGGMDPNTLRALAVSRKVMDQDAADRLSDTECFNLIFSPGFSTKDVISDVSGRGVGMDVVKTKIGQLNGTIDIESQLNIGTTISIKVPLTLAIMPTLMVVIQNQAFALPLASVSEIFHLDLTKTNVVDGQEVVVVRGKPIPLYYLKRWLIKGMASDHQKMVTGHVVVVTVGTQNVGFVVDQLVGQEEVVIKPLGQMLQGTPGMAGATITGDGRIALILDIPSLLKAHTGQGR